MVGKILPMRNYCGIDTFENFNEQRFIESQNKSSEF